VEADGIDPNDIKGRGKYLEARIAATRWVLAHPGVHVVQYTMTGPETVRAAVTAATTPFAAGDVARARAHDERARGAGCPVPCPAPCQEACPAGVAVAEVLHHRTYAEHHGLRLQARLDYAALPPSRQARACVDCASQACVEACPESLPVKQLMRAAHRVLGPA
jgi:predicted aldo/keto reductase-like oxidoreductase